MDKVDISSLLEQVRDIDLAYVTSWLDRIAEEVGADVRARWAEITKAK